MLLLLPTLKASIFNCIAKVRFTYFFDWLLTHGHSL
jgi:hypothetical protein